MPARPTTPVTMPVTMAGQSKTVTTCTAGAIASCMGFHPSCLTLSLGYSYSDSASWVSHAGEGGLYRMLAPVMVRAHPAIGFEGLKSASYRRRPSAGGRSFRVRWSSCLGVQPGRVLSWACSRVSDASAGCWHGAGRSEYSGGMAIGPLEPGPSALPLRRRRADDVAAAEIRNAFASEVGRVGGHVQRRGDEGHEI